MSKLDWVIPTTVPEASPVSLVTMTVLFGLDTFLNLKLISEYIELDDHILGVKFQGKTRGSGFRQTKTHAADEDSEPDEDTNSSSIETSGAAEADAEADVDAVAHAGGSHIKRSDDFKHQCTFKILTGTGEADKKVDVKLFNNGKMVFTGCTEIEQVKAATEILTERIFRLNGYLEYHIPTEFRFYRTKDIFRKEISRFRRLIHLLAFKLEFDVNSEPFNPALSDKEAYETFMTTHATMDPDETEELLLLLEIVSLIRTYYPDDHVTTWKSVEDLPAFVDRIINNIDYEQRQITDVFPSYLENDHKIEPNYRLIKVSNIVHKMNCGFFMNREAVLEHLLTDSRVVQADFDEDRYPGVIARVKVPSGGVTTAIFFHKGKVTITATQTKQQVAETHDFVVDFCREHFDKLILTSEYVNQSKKKSADMPNQFDLGEHEGMRYLLLKKDHILRNPRNVFLLRKFGLLECYE